MVNKKFYNLNPGFYLRLREGQKPVKKSPFDFKRSLQKALSGNYTDILFDEQLLDDRNLHDFFNDVLKSGLKPALQISSPTFQNKKEQFNQLNQRYRDSLSFNIIFEDLNSLPLKDIKVFLPKISLTYVVTKKNKNIQLKQKLPEELLKQTGFYFPYKQSLFDPFLTPGQVHRFIKRQGKVRPCPYEIYDRRIAQDMDLEPDYLPFAENKIPKKNKDIFFSIVIPSYNNGTQLANTLKYLAHQNFPRDKYEITVVDDGSTDHTKKAVKLFIDQHPSLNLKAIHFPRVIERKNGDARFRAGLARNLGVKYSQGQFLAFLDADILTPPDYLKRLEKEHEKAEVILLQRYHLKSNAPIKNLFFDPEELKGWRYIEEKNYWGTFYKKGFDQVKSPWKYICTYGLSLSREDFQSVGAFGKNFTFYGFEDTDLGYRLFKKNKTFLLSDIHVYHQAPDQRQQKHNPSQRYSQLSKTAKIFFYRHLDPEIYEELKIYMSQQRNLYYFLPFLRNNEKPV